MATLLEHTVMPSGGDFDNVSAAIEHIKTDHADFTLADVYGEVKIDGTWSSADTTAVTVQNIVTDATRNLKIYTTAQARSDGKLNAGRYRLVTNNNSAIRIYGVNYAHLDGLQIGVTAGSGAFHPIQTSATYPLAEGANQIDISNSLLYLVSDTTQAAKLVNIVTNYMNLNIWNCIGISRTSSVVGCAILVENTTTGVTVNAYSCTFVNMNGGGYGIRKRAGTLTAKNCYCGGAVTADYSGTMTKAACASSDLTGNTTPDDLTEIAVDTSTFKNVTSGSEDFGLVSGSPLIGKGTDTSGESAPLNFTTDIVGTARGSVWDVGAFEFVVAGSAILKIINE